MKDDNEANDVKTPDGKKTRSSSHCSTENRYAIFKGSQSAHCCFEASVVDTTKPEMIGGKHYKGRDGQYRYEAICECFDEGDAQRICDAMNGISQ